MWYDTLIAISIVTALVLAIIAKVTHQTMTELIKNIIDKIREIGEH